MAQSRIEVEQKSRESIETAQTLEKQVKTLQDKMGALLESLQRTSPDVVKALSSYGDTVANPRKELDRVRDGFVSKEQFDSWRNEASPSGLSGSWLTNGTPERQDYISAIGSNALLLVNDNHAATFGAFDPKARKITAFSSNTGWGSTTATVSQDGKTITWGDGTVTWKRGEH